MTTQRIFFLAIRHIPSGGFLPAQTSYGFTRTEPTLVDPPRLFTKKGPAKQALARWLEGALYEGNYDEDTNETSLKLVPRPHRRAAEMEIVEVELFARTLSDAQLRVL